MNVVELFLPLDAGNGAPVEQEVIEGIIKGLADRFGGATAFTRQPADGLWKDAGNLVQDRIIIIEVVVKDVDESWWREYRQRLEEAFQQDQIMIRVTPCRII